MLSKNSHGFLFFWLNTSVSKLSKIPLNLSHFAPQRKWNYLIGTTSWQHQSGTTVMQRSRSSQNLTSSLLLILINMLKLCILSPSKRPAAIGSSFRILNQLLYQFPSKHVHDLMKTNFHGCENFLQDLNLHICSSTVSQQNRVEITPGLGVR